MCRRQGRAGVRCESGSVERDDAGGFLAAMLQGVQAERGDGGGFRVTEDAEHAAFLAQRIAIEIEVIRTGRAEAEFKSGGVFGRAWYLVHRASLQA